MEVPSAEQDASPAPTKQVGIQHRDATFLQQWEVASFVIFYVHKGLLLDPRVVKGLGLVISDG